LGQFLLVTATVVLSSDKKKWAKWIVRAMMTWMWRGRRMLVAIRRYASGVGIKQRCCDDERPVHSRGGTI